MTAAGVRGRGGAGFPVGSKWSSVRASNPRRTYVVANGAEGELATFKDRTLMRLDPYRIVEGAAIAAYAVGAHDVPPTCATLELSAAGLLGDLQVSIVEGPDEYLFGEEKALLEVIEGRDPLPRLLPPWQQGLFATAPSAGWEPSTAGVAADPESNPTVVNSVESLAHVAHVLARGATWFRSLGTDETPGTLLVTVVGDVRRCGVFEVQAGTPLIDVLTEHAGGPRGRRRWRAAFSGVSNAVLVADDFDVALCFAAFAARGGALGAAGFAVYDDSRNLTSVARELTRFLAVESCGQCPPCKTGTMSLTERLLAIETGAGTDDDLEKMNRSLRTVTDANRCYIGTEAQTLVSSVLRRFPDDIARSLERDAAPLEPVLVPLVKDITPDGVAIYDERHARKLPDWTYAPE